MKQLIKLEIVYFLVWGFTLLPLSAMADGGEGLRRARQQAAIYRMAQPNGNQ